METPLEKRLSELRALTDVCAYNEEQAKQTIILPILSSLSWQVFNRDEVVAEFSIEPLEKDESIGRVDYCLKISGRNKVFIEAKRPGENLENYAYQLLKYAFRFGVRLAILTTGVEWWLYMPLNIGSWSERRFAVIDIRTDAEASHLLERFLGREAVATGTALRAAQDAIVENALPRAWSELCKERRESLIEELVGKLKDLTGYDADRQRVEQFLDDRSQATGELETETIGDPISTQRGTVEAPIDEAYWLRESPWTLETAKALLTIVKPLILEADLRFVQGYIAITGKRGNYFSFQKRASNRSLLWVRVLPAAVAEAALTLENAGLPCTKGSSNVQLSIDKEKVQSNPKLWERIAGFAVEYWKS